MKLKGILFILFILTLLFIIFIPRILKVGNVGCRSQFGPCNQIFADKFSALSGLPIGEARLRVAEILTKEVLVKDYSIQIRLPNNLFVTLLERKPKFALKGKEVNALALVDQEGYIVAISQISNLPQVEIFTQIGSVGEKVSAENFFILSLIGDLFSFYQVREGKVENGAFTVVLNERTKVIFPQEGDSQVLISTLSLVLKRFEGEEDPPREIDLRFKNPVLRE